jgi:hypothetical protein
MLSLEWHRIQFQVNFKLERVWLEDTSYFKILIYHHPGRTENTIKYFRIAGLCSDTKMWKPEHTATMVTATVALHSTYLFKLHCPKNAYVTAKVSVVSVPSHVLIHVHFCRPIFATNNTRNFN